MLARHLQSMVRQLLAACQLEPSANAQGISLQRDRAGTCQELSQLSVTAGVRGLETIHDCLPLLPVTPINGSPRRMRGVERETGILTHVRSAEGAQAEVVVQINCGCLSIGEEF